QRLAQLLFIDIPVAQSAEVVIPFSKPAVIHNDHVDAQLFGMDGKLIDGLAIKIKISPFPAVDKDRADGIFIFSSAYVIPDAGMKILRKAVKAIGAEGQNHLRSSKCIARLHRIIESVLLQADERADLIKLVLLHLCLKASAVHKCHT